MVYSRLGSLLRAVPRKTYRASLKTEFKEEATKTLRGEGIRGAQIPKIGSHQLSSSSGDEAQSGVSIGHGTRNYNRDREG